jgi:hypothetical protein
MCICTYTFKFISVNFAKSTRCYGQSKISVINDLWYVHLFLPKAISETSNEIYFIQFSLPNSYENKQTTETLILLCFVLLVVSVLLAYTVPVPKIFKTLVNEPSYPSVSCLLTPSSSPSYIPHLPGRCQPSASC